MGRSVQGTDVFKQNYITYRNGLYPTVPDVCRRSSSPYRGDSWNSHASANPFGLFFASLSRLSLAYDVTEEATPSAKRPAKYYSDAEEYHKHFQVGDKFRIRIPTLAQSSSKLESKSGEIHTICKIRGVVANFTDAATQSQTRVHVDRLTACSPRLREEFEALPSVSRSSSSSSLHGSMQAEPTRLVDSVDLATQSRALGKRLPKSTRRDDYVYLMYEYREMDMSLYEEWWRGNP